MIIFVSISGNLYRTFNISCLMFLSWPTYHYCRDNSKICSCGGDRQVFYWDVSTGRVIRKFRGHDSEVFCYFPTFTSFYGIEVDSQIAIVYSI